MKRVVLALFLGLLTFDVSGLAAICGDPQCDEDCPADGSGGECAPNCHACACCSLPKVAVAAGAELVRPPALRTTWIAASDRPSFAGPADIFHIPKLPLA